MRVKKVLMSVANHKGLVDFARRLCHIDIDIIAVEETMRMLMDNKICVGSFDDFVSRPALSYPHSRMLHPNVLDSIFSSDTDRSDFDPVQLIVINLDPYRRSPSFTAPIENMSRINIDESAIIRAAAKNYHRIAVVVDPSDYLGIWWELNHNGFCLSLETRQRLALKAFQHTAMYDASIANYMAQTIENNLFPQNFFLTLRKVHNLGHGENPHQKAALYRKLDTDPDDLINNEQHSGKELSFKNIANMDCAYDLAREFSTPACVVVNHNNPCGVGLAKTLSQAYEKALLIDPAIVLDSVIAVNRPVDAEFAHLLVDNAVKVVIAPSFLADAFVICKKSKHLRLIKILKWGYKTEKLNLDYKSIGGGLLVQEKSPCRMPSDQANVVTERKPAPNELRSLDLGRRVVKHAKSYAVAFARNNHIVAIGVGQPNQTHAIEFAIHKALRRNLSLKGTALASDDSFLSRDCIDIAAQAGVTAVVQPLPNKRDKKMIQAADQHNLAMIFSHTRHYCQ